MINIYQYNLINWLIFFSCYELLLLYQLLKMYYHSTSTWICSSLQLKAKYHALLTEPVTPKKLPHTVDESKADLPFKQRQAAYWPDKALGLETVLLQGLPWPSYSRDSVQLCTASFCQDKKILFAAIFDTLHPRDGLFVWPGITCHLYHLVSKNHRSLSFWLYSPVGIHTYTVTTHIQQHTCGSQNAEGFFSMGLQWSRFTVNQHFSAFIKSWFFFTLCFSVSLLLIFLAISLSSSHSFCHYDSPSLTYTAHTQIHMLSITTQSITDKSALVTHCETHEPHHTWKFATAEPQN